MFRNVGMRENVCGIFMRENERVVEVLGQETEEL